MQPRPPRLQCPFTPPGDSNNKGSHYRRSQKYIQVMVFLKICFWNSFPPPTSTTNARARLHMCADMHWQQECILTEVFHSPHMCNSGWRTMLRYIQLLPIIFFILCSQSYHLFSCYGQHLVHWYSFNETTSIAIVRSSAVGKRLECFVFVGPRKRSTH